MINYERHIRNALGRLSTPDTGMRLRVYRSAMQAFENKFGSDTTGETGDQRTLLADAIQMIEAEYRTES
ncbi:MAG: hypothetical protein COB78_02975 [Hyphomicrobiales bacterium]|nr:MAG: hypothetical protein COB78_02975 [Hyphomicrobiales bacterium]